MKDKRQRMSIVWPYTDPSFTAYMFNLASSAGQFHRYGNACVTPSAAPNPFMYSPYGNFRPHQPFPFPNFPASHSPTEMPVFKSSVADSSSSPTAAAAPTGWQGTKAPPTEPEEKEKIRTALFQTLLSRTN